MRCALPQRPSSGALFTALLAGVLGLCAGSSFATEIRVRARTHLSTEVRWSAGGLDLLGRVEDDARHGVGHRELTLSIAGWSDSATVLSGDDGEYTFHLSPEEVDSILLGGPTRRLSVAVVWPGDTRYGPSRLERDVDIDKLDVDLSVAVVPNLTVMGERPDLRVLAEAYSRGRAVPGLTVTVEIGAGAPRTLTTARDGRAVAGLPVEALPGPGELQVTARSAETLDFNAATARTTFLLVSPTTLTLTAEQPRSEPVPAVKVEGALSDVRGPVAGAVVTLVSDDLPITLAVTDRDGTFAADISAGHVRQACRGAAGQRPEALPFACRDSSRSLSLRAIYAPAEPWRRPSASEVVTARLPSPPRLPFVAYLASLGAGLLLLLLLRASFGDLLARARAWASRRRSRPLATRADARDTPAPTPLEEPVRPPPRTEDPHRIAGMTWDPFTERPVAGARLWLEAADGTQAPPMTLATTDPAGRFETPPLPEGAHTLVVEAAGYLTERLLVAVPHYGRLASVRLNLRAVRLEAAAVYRSFVEPLAGAGTWGFRTPREYETIVRRRLERGHDGVGRLTDAFEEIYFADRAPSEQAPRELKALIDDIREANVPEEPS